MSSDAVPTIHLQPSPSGVATCRPTSESLTEQEDNNNNVDQQMSEATTPQGPQTGLLTPQPSTSEATSSRSAYKKRENQRLIDEVEQEIEDKESADVLDLSGIEPLQSSDPTCTTADKSRLSFILLTYSYTF